MQAVFAPLGCCGVEVPRDSLGLGPGFAFLEFRSEAQRDAALSALQGLQVVG